MSRRLNRSVAIVLALVATSCTRITHADGTTFCGTHIDTGAEESAFLPLDPALTAPIAAPPASLLPSTENGPTQAILADYVRTSPNCQAGAVVAVVPADAARLTIVIRAGDGLIAGIGVDRVTAPVTVAAWVGGTYQGAVVLQPHG